MDLLLENFVDFYTDMLLVQSCGIYWAGISFSMENFI